MDGLHWKTLLKWMIWGYHHFWKKPILSFRCLAQISISHQQDRTFSTPNVLLHRPASWTWIQRLPRQRNWDHRCQGRICHLEQVWQNQKKLVGGFSPTPLIKYYIVKMGSSSTIFGGEHKKWFELPPPSKLTMKRKKINKQDNGKKNKTLIPTNGHTPQTTTKQSTKKERKNK